MNQTNLNRVELPAVSSASSGDLRTDVNLMSADVRPDVTTKSLTVILCHVCRFTDTRTDRSVTLGLWLQKVYCDVLGDHVITCTVHSGPKKAHDWAVKQLTDLFCTTHRVKDSPGG